MQIQLVTVNRRKCTDTAGDCKHDTAGDCRHDTAGDCRHDTAGDYRHDTAYLVLLNASC